VAERRWVPSQSCARDLSNQQLDLKTHVKRIWAASAIVAVAAVAGVAALATALRPAAVDSEYFGPFESIAVTSPAGPGERVYVGIDPMEVKPGDRVKFVSVDGGPAMTRALAAALARTPGGIGVLRGKDLAPRELDAYQALPTGEWSAADGPIALIIEVVMPTATLTITRPELTFIVNDGPPQHVHFPVAARFCLPPPDGPVICDSPEPPR